MTFSETILKWYLENKRALPWRDTKDPYKIWLSEIIMQQTRVAQGTPYYLRFVASFPTITALAHAPEAQVLKLWQGLGYYSRARNLHFTAKAIADDYDGVFPSTYHELLKLKGIGDYTASAIASICFNEPRPVVDGNVYRVLARYFGVNLPIDTSGGINHFKVLATKLMVAHAIGDYNQAIMEFGAVQCTPKKPLCGQCPLNNGCTALQVGQVNILPVKKGKTKIKDRYFNFLAFVISLDGGMRRTVVQQRKAKGIWQNLWQFPLLETDKAIDPDAFGKLFRKTYQPRYPYNIVQFNHRVIVHKLSHQNLHTTFWIVETDVDMPYSIPLREIDTFAVPVLLVDFIETLKKSYL